MPIAIGFNTSCINEKSKLSAAELYSKRIELKEIKPKKAHRVYVTFEYDDYAEDALNKTGDLE